MNILKSRIAFEWGLVVLILIATVFFVFRVSAYVSVPLSQYGDNREESVRPHPSETSHDCAENCTL
jgi:hypothetical protein